MKMNQGAIRFVHFSDGKVCAYFLGMWQFYSNDWIDDYISQKNSELMKEYSNSWPIKKDPPEEIEVIEDETILFTDEQLEFASIFGNDFGDPLKPWSYFLNLCKSFRTSDRKQRCALYAISGDVIQKAFWFINENPGFMERLWCSLVFMPSKKE